VLGRRSMLQIGRGDHGASLIASRLIAAPKLTRRT
jgi:hypothetical protein